MADRRRWTHIHRPSGFTVRIRNLVGKKSAHVIVKEVRDTVLSVRLSSLEPIAKEPSHDQ